MERGRPKSNKRLPVWSARVGLLQKGWSASSAGRAETHSTCRFSPVSRIFVTDQDRPVEFSMTFCLTADKEDEGITEDAMRDNQFH